jgi:hypothetical protein
MHDLCNVLALDALELQRPPREALTLERSIMPNNTTYHNDPARSGWFQVAKTGISAVGTWRRYNVVSLGAAVRGAPLVLENWTLQSGPHQGETHDLVLAATSDNVVACYAIDQLRTGSTTPIWSRHLAPALRRAGSNIPSPLGVCSTPVIDSSAGEMHVLALQDDGGSQLTWDLVSNTNGGYQGPQFGHNIADGRPFWVDDFSGSGQTEVLFYYPGDGNWWLGTFHGFVDWTYAGNTLGKDPGGPNFGQVWDGRPFWIADFLGTGRAQVLFYFPGDGNWWLAHYDNAAGRLSWSLAGNTSGGIQGQPNFGNLNDGHHHFWVGNFTGSAQLELLFYFEGDGNWWLGQYNTASSHFFWSLAGNTLGKIIGQPNFGQIWDGRPFWAGHFTGNPGAEILFYTPFDGNWWLASYNPASGFLQWSLAGNTLGKISGQPNFGQIWDGRPFWFGHFTGTAQAQILFYTPGDGNWWLATYNNGARVLDWSLAGNTLGKVAGQPNFGNVADGHHHFWIGTFTGTSQDCVMFYFEGDGNWWLASYDSGAGHFVWNFAGNTLGKVAGQPNFGQIWDGRPFWTGRFTGGSRTEILFYTPFDDNWWFGSCANGVYHPYVLDVNTGAVLRASALQDSGVPARPTFDGHWQDQRGALNLVGGWVYATFADFAAYDLDVYHGWMVGWQASNPSVQRYVSTTRNVLGGGVWGPGGAAAASDGTLYVATGNATTADNNYWNGLGTKHPGDIGDFFEGVTRISGSPNPAVLDWYLPTDARAQNDHDWDLGGSSPLLLPTIGNLNLVVVTGKDGNVYLLDRLNLGHWGNEKWRAAVFSNESKCAPASYRSSSGDFFVFVIGSGTPGLVCYKVVVTGTAGSLQQTWLATGPGITLGDAPGSPAVATFPDQPAVVWIVDDNIGAVRAFRASDGVEVYSSANRAADALGPLPHFPPVTCASSSIFVGTARGIACYGA